MAGEKVNKVIYDGNVLIDLMDDTVDAAHLLIGYTAHDASGEEITGSCDYTANPADGTAGVDDVLYGETFYAGGSSKKTGNMPNRGAVSGVITTKAQEYTIQQGYHDGSGKVMIDSTEQSKLIATNIRKDITILGVTGSMTGSEDVHAQTKTVTPTSSQQTINPDGPTYNYLSSVVVNAIPYSETVNAKGGLTVTIG